MSVFGFLGTALARGAELIDPLFGTAATAVAIVLCTLAVRAALHPLARAAARGERARAALAPQLAELQRKHKGNPERLRKAMADLYATAGASPLAGCLPSLLQLPVFYVMYHLFSNGSGGLLDHTLLGAPLGGRWYQALADGGLFGPRGLVYLALFALIAAVATWNFRRARATAAKAPQPAAGAGGGLPGMAGMTKLLPLLSFGTLITVAVVPLAAALYVVTTTTWTACERALLHRDRDQGRESGPELVPASASVSASAGKAAPEGAKARAGAGARAADKGAAREATAVQEAGGQRPAQPRSAKSRAARQRAARSRATARTRADSRTAGSRAAGSAAANSRADSAGTADGSAAAAL
ncbi:YidC/Oxa1 family membrane protein insertase [Streptomyces celluloflavus]|uniref:Membrane protein insertase YidC n=1 Tax=Streptomyces celluloflavus TaxID=58344 RepID=A0ABW7RJG9_9ACTN|nr:YidC/Oxa1 family membrane protein insertase [Streptomyces celluloflavus]